MISHVYIYPYSDPAENFLFWIQLSDQDLENSGSVSDTLGLPLTRAVTSPTTEAAIGLVSGGVRQLTVTSNMTLNDTECHSVRYVCLLVSAGGDSSYLDSSTSDNWKCLDKASEKACDTGTLTEKDQWLQPI